MSVSAEETDQTSKLSLNQLFGITASKTLDNEIRSAEEPLNSVYNAFKLHQRTDPSAQVS